MTVTETRVDSRPDHVKKLDHAVRMYYASQKMRLQAADRARKMGFHKEPSDKEYLANMGKSFEEAEKLTLKRIKYFLEEYFPVYDKWLKHQAGCGPTMSGVLLSRLDIHRATTPSKIWAICGLAVKDGKIQRLAKGQKAEFDPFLKSRVVHVLGDSFIKAVSVDEDTGNYVRKSSRIDKKTGKRVPHVTVLERETVWRRFYDDYKNRKANTTVAVCMACKGEGSVGKKDCWNCDGSGKNAPWGTSNAHRSHAARRYMVKMFLQQLYVEWRNVEGLPVRVPYSEQYLDHKHAV